MAGDARYSALVGAAGEGEQDSPRQPYAAALFELLLERGADPFDIQVLYDTHFSGEMLWWLELVYKHTIGTPRGEAWKEPGWPMFDMGGYGSGARFLLEVAVNKGDLRLADWLLAHGANPDAAPARDPRLSRHTLYQLALVEGRPEMAELFARYGASRAAPALDDAERFVDAVLRLDREAARSLLTSHPEYRESPHAMFEAARRNRPEALALLLDLGFPLEIQDRTGKRALHEAAFSNAIQAAAFLVERGAAIDPRESTYNGTPIGWAAHGDRTAMVRFLSQYSRDIWALCFSGCVDRVRTIVADDPGLARAVSAEGITPLWWLPDDEALAMQIVELLIAAGADPARKSRDGRTAADRARRRGMRDVVARLETAMAERRSE